MRTEHVEILLPDYLQGRLTSGLAAVVEEHLQSCAACRSEAEFLRQTFASLDEPAQKEVPGTYFPSILPRVRQQLDRKKRWVWMNHPAVNKILLPLGVAAVLFVVLWRVPGSWWVSGNENSLQNVLTTASADEIADALQESATSQDAGPVNTAILARVLSDDRLVRRQIVSEALNSETMSPFDVVAGVTPQQVLSDLPDSDADLALQQLESMEIL